MISLRKCRIFGLQLLLFIHATESFVLLTANFEDVKKLARKFVPEDLAEKIALFLTNTVRNVQKVRHSEEIQKDVSEENENFNLQVSEEFDKKRTKKVSYPERIHEEGRFGHNFEPKKSLQELFSDDSEFRHSFKTHKRTNEDNLIDSDDNRVHHLRARNPDARKHDDTKNDDIKYDDTKNYDKELVKKGVPKLIATSGNIMLTKMVTLSSATSAVVPKTKARYN